MLQFKHFSSDYPCIPEPIHISNKVLSEEIYVPDNHIHLLDKELKNSHIVTDQNHIKEIKKYTNGSFELNKKLLELYKNKSSPTRFVKGRNYDWFNSHGENKPPYNGFHNYEVTHDLFHLDNLTKNNVGKHLKVYSGIRFNPEDHMDHRKILHIPSYYSTTIDPKITKEFSEDSHGTNRVIKLHLEPHNKGIYIDKHHTFQNGEYKELLLPRHTSIKIFHKEENFIDNQPTTIYHAKIHQQR